MDKVKRLVTLELDSVKIDYAHVLTWHTGKCKNLHGHSGLVDVKVSGYIGEADGLPWLIDFTILKNKVKELSLMFDHKLLLNKNRLEIFNIDKEIVTIVTDNGYEFKLPQSTLFILSNETTAEELAYLFADRLLKELPKEIIEIEVGWQEGPGNKAIVKIRRDE